MPEHPDNRGLSPFAEVPAIGFAVPRYDAFAKVCGQELYASDYYPKGFLWLGVKRSDHVHARILSLDTRAAASVPGVVGVLTHRDIKGTNRVGLPEGDMPVLCDDKVRHLGDPVALIIARTREAIGQAALLVQVDYEVLPSVVDPETALLPDAPLVHDKAPQGNVLLSGHITTGQGAEGLAGCAYRLRREFVLPWQEHAYLETECGVAWMEEKDRLVVVVSTQSPFRDRLEVATSLGLRPDQVRIVAPHLGGGFGGKDGITVQALLGLGALHAGRPVKLVNTREESFISSSKRHQARITYEVGCNGDGILQALKCRLLLDTGAYSCLGPAVLSLALEHAGGIYRFPHAFLEGYLVYTNNPMGGAFRGFGVPQVTACLEQLIDDLAREVHRDPLDFRRRNVLRRGDRNACGVIQTESIGAASCLEKIAEHECWQGRRAWTAAAPPGQRRGVGLACSLHGMGYGPVVPDHASAKVELAGDGTIILYAGVADMGQGNGATFAQIVGAILNQKPQTLRLVMPDTDRTLPSGSSSASRTTFTFGHALIQAADLLRQRILQRARFLAQNYLFKEVAESDLVLLPQGVCHLVSGQTFPLATIAQAMDGAERCCTYSYTAPTSPQAVGSSAKLRQWGIPHRIFSFAAHLALVQVDEWTGEVNVCQYLASTDAGRILNPDVYEQQVQGGVAQGLGYALTETFRVEKGVTQTRNFTTYTIPTSRDVPDIVSLPVEQMEALGPYGMKGLGEIVIDPVYAAIANAVADAASVRIGQGPLTPERILEALGEGRATPPRAGQERGS